MRNIFVVLFLTCFIILQAGCGGSSADTNLANANTQTPSDDSNQNAQVQDTPLPQFTDAETALAEGNKLFDVNKNELAVEAYNQAVKLNPDLAEAWFKLGIAYSLIEKEREIESVNNQEIEETPTPTPSRKSKKEQVIRTKDSEKAFEKAVVAYKKFLAKNPDDDIAHFNLGRAYNKLDEDEDALKSLRQAVKLKPDNTEYQTELGAILIKLAQYDEAVKVLKKALELDPENSEADELLEKAEAGKKRINFGVTPKTPTPQDTLPKTKPTVKPSETQSPAVEPKPMETKPEKKDGQ
jgi:tetratricopeptide (TPR) repeat protein